VDYIGNIGIKKQMNQALTQYNRADQEIFPRLRILKNTGWLVQ
jgi:hypothetical protein